MNSIKKYASKATTVADRIIKYILAYPPAISGDSGHNRLLVLAIKLVHGYCLSEAEATEYLLQYYNPRCQPEWTEKEVARKVSEASKMSSIKPRGWLLNGSQSDPVKPTRLPAKKVPMPKKDPVKSIHKLVGEFRCTQEDLINKSPCKLTGRIQKEDFKKQAPMLFSHLYKRDDLIRVVVDSKQSEKGKWHPIGHGGIFTSEHWQKTILYSPLKRSDGGCWMGMNPLDGDGVADKNVTSCMYALIESDDIEINLQATLLAKLPLPIVAIIHSGGRSLQALVEVAAESIDQYKKIVSALFGRLADFGVDTMNKNAARMCRLPGVYRGDQPQRLVYLNPEPSTESIL